MSETPYAETEFLLAVMNEDERRARELLDDMTACERDDLAHQLRAGDRLIKTGIWT